MSHERLLKNLPGVKNLIFLPLWDYIEEKMIAGCFLWTSSTGRMMNLDDDLSYLRAFGNTIMSEVWRMNALKDDRAKTTFIASMSHELRSPLHGILGSVEFLQETANDAYQAGLVRISQCINHENHKESSIIECLSNHADCDFLDQFNFDLRQNSVGYPRSRPRLCQNQ
jgi:signal transduction histidine kinase